MNVDQLNFLLYRYNSTPPQIDYYVYNGDGVDGSVVTSGNFTIDHLTPNTFTWVSVTDSFTLTEGQTYTIRLKEHASAGAWLIGITTGWSTSKVAHLETNAWLVDHWVELTSADRFFSVNSEYLSVLNWSVNNRTSQASGGDFYVSFAINTITAGTDEAVANRASYTKEARVWLSKTGAYDNFQEGVKDDDSFSLVVPSKNEMSWLGGLESLLLGTSGDEWRVGSNKLDTPLTPLNATIKQQTEWGSNRIKPIKINSALIFVNFTSLVLREMAWLDSKYESPDLTALAEHITKTGVTTMARQKEPDSILWLTLTDGKLVSFTYNREQNVLAFATHPLGGGGLAMSVCVTPGVPEDNITLSVGRTIDGAEVTYIERLKPRKYSTITDCFFVDCGITATNSTASSTVTGLDHLEGETVKLLVDGVEADEDVVDSGQVTVSFAGVASTTWTTAHVGLAFTSLLQPLRIVVGDSHGAITKVPELNASFLDTGAAFYGNDDSDVKAIDFTQIGLINTSDITGLYTGQTKLTMPGGFSVESPIFITSDKPLPCTVRALMCRIEKTSR